MSILPDVGLSRTPSVGSYQNPGDPLQNVWANLGFADQLRGTVTEVPILIVSIGYIYDRVFIDGNPDREWRAADLILVIVIAWAAKRIAIGNRWEGRL